MTSALDIKMDWFGDLKKKYPECFFIPKYPYNFQFDLIINGVNFGAIEIVIKDCLDIDEIKCSKDVLSKLKEITEKQIGKTFEMPEPMEGLILKPLERLDELMEAIKNEGWDKNGDFKKIKEYIVNTYTPLNSELLYKKTGVAVLF